MSLKILVIDDEPDLELLIIQRFRHEIESHELIFDFAANGLEGLEKIESTNDYVVILTDLKMPVMDGLTLLTKLKEKNSLSKAIVVSAYDDLENIRAAMNNDAFDFIVKPISFDDLKLTLNKAFIEYDNTIKGLEARKQLIEAVKEKEAAILRERLRISRDLHDDIGATLSSISVSCSAIQQRLIESKFLEVSQLLEGMSADAREMVTGMSDIVWLINPHNDSLEKLLDRIHKYASTVLPSNNIVFIFNPESVLPNIALTIDQRKNIYLILKECINNAAKHSQATEVRLEVLTKNGALKFELIDNGKGFLIEEGNDGNGLKNIRMRAEEINADYHITTTLQKGTSVMVSVK